MAVVLAATTDGSSEQLPDSQGRLRGRHRQHNHSHRREEGVQLSLFSPFPKLPPDGQVITDAEAQCDPYHSNCKTACNVWESKCKACFGTGQCVSGSSRRGGHRSLHTCLMCHGIGFVRRSSTTVIPDISNDNNATLGREPPAPTQASQPVLRRSSSSARSSRSASSGSSGDGKSSTNGSSPNGASANGASAHGATANGAASNGTNGSPPREAQSARGRSSPKQTAAAV
ncbi:hypothetical protein WJX73_003941 [Symbiochloris irregularis]|uniref:Uncharacterized protein n=1 Tax=Symbiochloris irregularis TaxID=706552 RepID=A0AAW1PCB9_9CHLO